jgi:hypothetical protein
MGKGRKIALIAVWGMVGVFLSIAIPFSFLNQ